MITIRYAISLLSTKTGILNSQFQSKRQKQIRYLSIENGKTNKTNSYFC